MATIGRVSQAAEEALQTSSAKARASQSAEEVLETKAAKLRTSQVVREILYRNSVHVSQAIFETLITPAKLPDAIDGGGITVPTDPSQGSDFSGRAVDFRVWLEIQFDDATRSYAGDTVNTTGGQWFGCVLDFGSINYQISDRYGAYKMTTVSVTIDDAKRTFSQLETLSPSQHWLYREVRIKMATSAVIASGGTPWTVFRGIWTGYTTKGNQLTFEFNDRLGSLMLDQHVERTVPRRTFAEDFSGRFTSQTDTNGDLIPVSAETLARHVPVAYGFVSDEFAAYAGLMDPAQRRGRVEPIYVGTVVGLNGTTYHEWVLCGHAIYQIRGSYISYDKVSYVGMSQLTDYIGPDSPSWSSVVGSSRFKDYNGNRYTTVYRPLDSVSDQIIAGTAIWSFNLLGADDVGDGTGAAIVSTSRCLYHLLNNWVFLNYTSGAWPSVPTSPDGLPWLDAQSFVDCETWETAQTGDGFQWGIYIQDAMTMRDLMEQIASEGMYYFGQNLFGQLTAMHIPAYPVVDTISDVQEIYQGTGISRAVSDVINQLTVQWDYRPLDKTWSQVSTWDARNPPAGFAAVPTALDAVNGRLVKPSSSEQRLWAQRPIDVVTVVAARLTIDHPIPRIVTVEGPVHWLRIKLGSLISATDLEGLGASGWTDRPLWVEGVAINLGAFGSAPSVTLTCRDMYGLI